MSPDIVIVKEPDGYHLLHGHLRLASVLLEVNEIAVDVRGEGEVKVVRVGTEYVVHRGGCCVPLHRH